MYLSLLYSRRSSTRAEGEESGASCVLEQGNGRGGLHCMPEYSAYNHATAEQSCNRRGPGKAPEDPSQRAGRTSWAQLRPVLRERKTSLSRTKAGVFEAFVAGRLVCPCQYGWNREGSPSTGKKAKANTGGCSLAFETLESQAHSPSVSTTPYASSSSVHTPES